MNDSTHMINEQAAAKAFNKQAPVFDELYNDDLIIQYKRSRVRDHISHYLKPDSYILELNAGTGEDAIFFAGQGHRVHATDISSVMQKKLNDKVRFHDLQGSITSELCSFTNLKSLYNRGPYDLIFSNFAGLNCTDQLDQVLRSFDSLLKPGGFVTLVILPKFCLWEFMLLFRGKFKTAFRRFSGRKGTRAHIEGEYFKCWYYDPSFIKKNLGTSFEPMSIEGLCTLVPPSYIEKFGERHPKTFRYLKKREDKLKGSWPWKNIGDYYIITLQKKG